MEYIESQDSFELVENNTVSKEKESNGIVNSFGIVVFLILLFLGIVVYVEYQKYKQVKEKQNKEKEIDNEFASKGFRKIYKDIYVNDIEELVHVFDREFKFTEMVDFDYYENGKSIITDSHISITIVDLDRPKIFIPIFTNERVQRKSYIYKKVMKEVSVVIKELENIKKIKESK